MFIEPATKGEIKNTSPYKYTKFYDKIINSNGNISGGVYYGGIQNEHDGKITGIYRTVSFDLYGGNGTVPTQWFVNALEATALVPAAPTKENYEFMGWYDGYIKYDFAKAITNNITLIARWVKNTVETEAELRNAINLGLTTIKLMSDINLSSALDLSGKDITIDLNGYVISGADILFNVGNDKASLTLKDSRPTATHTDSTLPVGGVVKSKISMNRNGGYDPCVLYANGGTVTSNFYTNTNVVAVKSTSDTPTVFTGNITGYPHLYGGIYYGTVSGSVTFEESKITFKNGDSNYAYEVLSSDKKSFDPITPSVKSGYQDFDGWYNGNTKYTFGSALSEDITLTAKYKNPIAYNITYNLDGGAATNLTSYTVESDAITLNNPTKTGYTFTGWSGTGLTGNNNKTVTVAKGSTGNRSYTAHFSQNSYTVKFDAAGGTEITDKTNVKWMDKVLDGITAPTRSGYTFDGWKCDDITVTADTTYAELAAYDTVTNIVLTAQWTVNQYTITFDTDGGSKIDSITQNYGTPITAPANPTREGYTFEGWDNPIPSTMPAENKIIKAQWKDSENPTGEIKISENSWKVFLNNITFGLFFKETQMVTITASDNSGEGVTIEYLLSDQEMNKTELDGMTFTAYTVPFGIDPDNEYIIYVKLTDTAGNTAYICSNGIVIDATAPVITGIENGKTYCEAQTVTIDEKYVDTVAVNEKAVTLNENGNFVLSPAEVEQKIVVTDKAGNTAEMTVTVNNGHTAFADDNDCTTPVYCKFCNAEVVAAKSHDFTGAWHNDDIGHWHECQNENCNATDAVIAHSGADDGDCTTALVCECGYIITAANSEHTFGEWMSNGDDAHTRKCTVDGCTNGIENENCRGGEATCKDKAVCEICGKTYGGLDSNNHANLEHNAARAATEDADGNIEYWRCNDCGKYFSDKDCTNEITTADIVIEKLPKEKETPYTGENNNITLWITMLFISGTAVITTTVIGKKKHSDK